MLYLQCNFLIIRLAQNEITVLIDLLTNILDLKNIQVIPIQKRTLDLNSQADQLCQLNLFKSYTKRERLGEICHNFETFSKNIKQMTQRNSAYFRNLWHKKWKSAIFHEENAVNSSKINAINGWRFKQILHRGTPQLYVDFGHSNENPFLPLGDLRSFARVQFQQTSSPSSQVNLDVEAAIELIPFSNSEFSFSNKALVVSVFLSDNSPVVIPTFKSSTFEPGETYDRLFFNQLQSDSYEFLKNAFEFCKNFTFTSSIESNESINVVYPGNCVPRQL